MSSSGTRHITSLLIIFAPFGLSFASRDHMHGHTFGCRKKIRQLAGSICKGNNIFDTHYCELSGTGYNGFNNIGAFNGLKRSVSVVPINANIIKNREDKTHEEIKDQIWYMLFYINLAFPLWSYKSFKYQVGNFRIIYQCTESKSFM